MRLVRIVESVACAEPWQVARSIRDSGTRVMAWSAPTEDPTPLVFIAAGIADELRPEGGDRFADTSRWWTQASQQIIELDFLTGDTVQSGTPACLAGFAFSTGLERSEAWQGWDDGAICVPQILVIQDHAGSRAVYTLSEGQGLAELDKLRTRLMGWLDHSRPVRTPAAANGAVQAAEGGPGAWTAWQERVEAARSSLLKGTMDKVVLARAQAYRTQPDACFDPLGTALALRDRQSDSTTFMIQRKDGQAFLGATPEVLVRLRTGRVDTVAMAGTRRRGQEAGDDEILGSELLASAKDRLEQQLVADAICQALDPVVSDLRVPEDPEVVRLPDVQHLRTRISGQLRSSANIFDLLRRLHPTPAVGGLPREPALRWLDDHEALDRGWYAGPIGWVDAQGNGEFVVAIRSVLMADQEAAAFAGCGLVAHSDARDEWEESIIKLQTVRRGLAFRTGIES
jgi:isochorismate synthase